LDLKAAFADDGKVGLYNGCVPSPTLKLNSHGLEPGNVQFIAHKYDACRANELGREVKPIKLSNLSRN
jgi:hypothetical protein